MAGKTSRGVGGKKEDAAPMLIADEPDMPGNSGPTVVDDAKVAEVLKKLRSLDVQSGPPGGVAEVVLDSGSSEPTRLDSGSIEIDSGPVIDRSGVEKLLRSSQRTTAVGRSLATPVVGQPVTIPADLARGTLFGRSIHVPDVNAPDGEAVDLDSGAVVDFLEGAPPPSQPFPLADNLVLPPPTSQPLQVYDAGTGSFSETGLGTQLVDPPKSRAFAKTIAFLGGIGIIAGGFWAWQQYGKSATPPPTAVAPAAEPAKPAPPPNDPMPPGAAAADEPAAAATKPSAAPSPTEAAPAANAAKPEAVQAPEAPAAKPSASAGDEPAPPPRAKESSRQRGHRSSASSERRSAKPAAAPPAPDTSDAAEKPGHGKKHPVEDDPDNTMAPSSI